MEQEKSKNNGLIMLVVILFLLVLGLGGYIVYDKVLSNKEEARLLEEDDYQSRLAWGIYIGIQEYFKQKETSQYEEKLLKYLSNGNNLILESKYNNVLCEFDLLIASQMLIYYIGKTLNIDVSKPKYSEEAMKIYFYKGQL